MRDEKEIMKALVLMREALDNPELKRRIWGDYKLAPEKALWAFSGVCWAAGSNDTIFAGMLEHIQEKAAQLREENLHVVS